MSLARDVFDRQKTAYIKGSVFTYEQRLEKLRQLKKVIHSHRSLIHDSIFQDFKKNQTEVDLTELFPVLSELRLSCKSLKKWMKPKRVFTPLTLFTTRSQINYEPKGVVLIISPWNYPFNLAMAPLVAVISAGNRVIIKPSEISPQTSKILSKIIKDVFSADEVCVFEGDVELSKELLSFPFDHIFFTGSPAVGRAVMAAASKNLTSVTLELGGKSPCIIDETALLKQSAERIIWGKFVNAGQTCIAPDYLFIKKNKVDEFVKCASQAIEKYYGTSSKKSSSYCRIINQKNFLRLKEMVNSSVEAGANICAGGAFDQSSNFISPTLLNQVSPDTAIMQEEIFGPILPIMTYDNIEEVINYVRGNEKPLAAYFFSESSTNKKRFLSEISAGGVAINNCLLHFANHNLPFGGTGNSGLGSYHGYFGFKEFSHEKAVLHQHRLDVTSLFRPPYTVKVKKLVDYLLSVFG